jgi:hypothetical protein
MLPERQAVGEKIGTQPTIVNPPLTLKTWPVM